MKKIIFSATALTTDYYIVVRALTHQTLKQSLLHTSLFAVIFHDFTECSHPHHNRISWNDDIHSVITDDEVIGSVAMKDYVIN